MSGGLGPGVHHRPGSVEADAEFEWLSPNERVRLPFERSWEELLLLAAEYDLCLTGACITRLSCCCCCCCEVM